jgi:hypothetical protein
VAPRTRKTSSSWFAAAALFLTLEWVVRRRNGLL